MFRKGLGGALAVHGIKHNRPLETAVGVGLMLNSGGSSHKHKSHHKKHVHQHVETAAEKESRLAREQAQRLQREEEQKREMAIASQEEIQRIQNYDEHIALIMRAAALSPEDLIKGIASLKPLTTPGMYYSNSDKKGMPECKEENLFNILLTRDLPDEITLQGMQLLFERGYLQSALMQEPLLSKFVRLSSTFDKIICESYISQIKSLKSIHQNVELQIWNRVAKSKNEAPEIIFDTLQSWRRNSLPSVNFARTWLNALDSVKDVVAISKFLESRFEGREQNALSYLNKVAEQRILALEIEKSPRAQESEKVKLTKDPIIASFLSSHRTSCCICSKTAAEKTYEKIVARKRDEAARELAAQQKQAADSFRQFRGNS